MARCLGCNFTHICITAMAVPNNFFVCSCCQDVLLEDAHIYVSRSIFNPTSSSQLPVSTTTNTTTTITTIRHHFYTHTCARTHACTFARSPFFLDAFVLLLVIFCFKCCNLRSCRCHEIHWKICENFFLVLSLILSFFFVLLLLSFFP